MSKYTIKDVANIVPDNLTTAQREAVEDYLNKGTIPAPDPCQNCDPNFIRKLIGLIETAKRAGLFPPKRINEPVRDLDWVEDGYVAGIIGKEELEAIRAKRPEMYEDEDVDTLDE